MFSLLMSTHLVGQFFVGQLSGDVRGNDPQQSVAQVELPLETSDKGLKPLVKVYPDCAAPY